MPNYDYFCSECDIYFEKMVPLSERTELQECPECEQKIATKAYISPPHGLVLSTAESAAKRAGLDPLGKRRAEYVRNKRQKDSATTEASKKSNEYWVPGHTYGEGGNDSVKKK
jgi:putative FmdB family regulatory protein